MASVFYLADSTRIGIFCPRLAPGEASVLCTRSFPAARGTTARRQSAMSMMLTLIQAGWEAVRSSVAHGRRTDALTRLKRLIAHPEVPTPVAADAHRLAGELQSDAE